MPPIRSEPDEVPGDYVFVTDFHDALTNGKEVLILRSSMVTALQGIGADLWLWAQSPCRFDHLLEKATQKHGEPGGESAVLLVGRALDTLRANGFVVAKVTRLT